MNPIIFEQELDQLIKSTNLSIDVVYNILKVKQLELRAIYYSYNQQLLLKEKIQNQKKEEENNG